MQKASEKPALVPHPTSNTRDYAQAEQAVSPAETSHVAQPTEKRDVIKIKMSSVTSRHFEL